MIDISVYASGSTGNLIQVSDGETKLILECGLPIASIKKHLGFKLSEISACLLSHAHLDHARGATGIMTSGLDLYCSQDTASRLNLSGHRLHIIQPLKPFKIDSFTILPFDGVHNIPVLGFLIQNKQGEKLCFIIDSAYCKYFFKNLNYIMIGINYCEDILRKNIREGIINAALGRRIMQSHCGLQTALGFLKINVCEHTKAIYPIHVSSTNADKDQIKEAITRQTGKLVLI